MTFLNLILLGGTVATFAPLIIHLLNRSRFRTLEWGAMHLLESAVKINSRRIQWRAWFLLLLRMIIPLLLALCLARPVLTAWRTATGGAQTSIVIVVDNSLSMEGAAEQTAVARSANRSGSRAGKLKRDDSAFAAAIEEALQVVEAAGPSTELSVYTSGGGPVNQASGSSFDSKRAMQRIASIESGAGSSPWIEVLTEGLNQLGRSQQMRRHLIVLSDFQKSEWDGISPDALSALRPNDEKAASSTHITFIPIGHKGTENVSVEIDRPSGSNVARGQAIEVRATVRNHGKTKLTGLPVTFAVNDTTLASKTVDVAADSQVFLVFKCQLDALGSQLVRVSIDERKAREAAGESNVAVVTSDDESLWAVDVIEPVDVLLVGDPPPKKDQLSDSLFLNFALTPYAASIAVGSLDETTAGQAEALAGVDPIRCQVKDTSDVNERELSLFQVVALANVKQMDAKLVQRLPEFVERGGVLVVYPGEATDPAWYNKHWGPESKTPLLSRRFGNFHRVVEPKEKPQRIQLETFNHPSLTLFNRSSNGRLDSVDFKAWYQLVQPTESATSTKQQVLLQLENGEPLLVETQYGKGRVYQWATSTGDQWSNLPLREVFVPLMQQVFLSGATSGAPKLNVATGERLVVSIADRKDAGVDGASKKETSDAAAKLTAVELLTSKKVKHRLDLAQRGDVRTATFSGTQFPGVYQVGGWRKDPVSFVVSPTQQESDLTPETAESFGAIKDRLGAESYDSARAFWEAERVKQTGREIFRWILVALVACLFLELILQQSITRQT